MGGEFSSPISIERPQYHIAKKCNLHSHCQVSCWLITNMQLAELYSFNTVEQSAQLHVDIFNCAQMKLQADFLPLKDCAAKI